MCPTCLSPISLKLSHTISEAHITPKYSGGTLKTYLCTGCNSKFGAHQDKWLGEYLRLRASGRSLFSTTKQTGRFSVNDIAVSGQFREAEDGSLQFLIWNNKTSPDSLRQLDQISQTEPLSISAELPVLRKSRQVEVGLLTAAYLMWFKEMGYSWVFQRHLDKIRRQILNPDEVVIDQIAVANMEQEVARPWIGIIEIGTTALAAASIGHHIVLLPTFSTPDIAESVSSLRGQTIDTRRQILRYCDGHNFGQPFGIMYQDKAIVASDSFSGAKFKYVILRYDGVSEEPTIFYPMSEEEYQRMSKESNVSQINITPDTK